MKGGGMFKILWQFSLILILLVFNDALSSVA
jgi:hypothetical protein